MLVSDAPASETGAGSFPRVGLVGPLPPPAGGMANQCEQLARLLQSEGVNVTLVRTNAPYRPALVGRIPFLRAVFRLIPYVARLWKVAGSVDVIHVLANSDWAWYMFAAPALLVARVRGTPTIINYRGGNADPFFSRAPRHVMRMLAQASMRVTPSDFLRRVFAQHGLGADVIPNIVDLSRFVPRQPRAFGNAPHVVVTRNLEPIYDIPTAIQGFAQVRKVFVNARMTVAGTGPELANLQALVSQLGLTNSVQFSGRIDNSNIPALYASADCMINSSTVDNMPVSILEALASGVPVVSTCAGGIPDMVQHGVSGLLVPVGDAAVIAREVLRVLQDSELAAALRRAGLEEARKYDWPQVREKWLNAYSASAVRAQTADMQSDNIQSSTALWWWRSRWLAEFVLVIGVLLLTPWVLTSTEMVRVRNALLSTDESFGDTNFDWTPANIPASFKQERGPIDPFFVDVAGRLRLAALPDDWSRAVAISRHLLSSHPVLVGGAIESDLRGTYRRIVMNGEGYCGDFTDVFVAIALAGGMQARAWAFSFDGFGGHGHIWPEIWNRQLGRWQLVGISNNHYFSEADGVPLSALEFRGAMLRHSKTLKLTPLDPGARPGWTIEEKAWDYYRRGLPEWYMWWGNDVFTQDRAPLSRMFSGISRSLEQLGAILQGVSPSFRILSEPGNLEQRHRLRALLNLWLVIGSVVLADALLLLVSTVFFLRSRRMIWNRAIADMRTSNLADPQVIVLTNLFPHAGTPTSGLSLGERVSWIAESLPTAVIVPLPWFPIQGLLAQFRSNFRPSAPWFELKGNVPVFAPRFLSVPLVLRCLDGWMIAISCFWLVRRLKRQCPRSIVDAQFAYPAGYAAVVLGGWLHLPVAVSLRGTEVSLAKEPCRRARMSTAVKRATRVLSVSVPLRRLAGQLGANESEVRVLGNGVDTARFFPEDRRAARARFGIPPDAPVLVSVGSLVGRKGFHHVISALPKLISKHAGLRFLVVGGPSSEGDASAALRRQVIDLELAESVHFLGALPIDEVRWALSAGNVFVLASSNEGWASVLLEAMACALPVITTNAGANAEAVCRPELGCVVEVGNDQALADALDRALSTDWDRGAIVEYARSNTWQKRATATVVEFRALTDDYFEPSGSLIESRHAHD